MSSSTSRRARVRPEDSGLPAHDNRRRVPGLKREEVALLAGVSVDYYARLERGHLGGVSASVLDAVADALRLDDAERQHLRDLADAAGVPERKLRTRTPKAPTLRPSVLALLARDDWRPGLRPQLAGQHPRGQRPVPRPVRRHPHPDLPLNLARFVFLDGRAHGFFLDWDEVADGTVGALRAEAGRNPIDKPLTDLIGELSARSHPFATKWAQHNVRLHRTATKHLHNSVIGDIELTGDALDLAGDGLTIIAYTAKPGSAAEEKLAMLGSWQRSKATTRV